MTNHLVEDSDLLDRSNVLIEWNMIRFAYRAIVVDDASCTTRESIYNIGRRNPFRACTNPISYQKSAVETKL